MSAGEGGSRRRGRKLSDDERSLWKGVTRSVSPLRRRAAEPAEVAEPVPTPAPVSKGAAKRSKPAPAPVASPPAKPATPPLAPLGRRFKQRLSRGTDPIDARLDLHGRTQAEAFDALLGFLRRSQARGARTVLVITGKGSSDPYSDRGVLKRLVPMWLGQSEFRIHIVGFEQATTAHGGEGALYVRLRRTRSEPV